MKVPGKQFVAKRVITYEVLSFAFILLILWLDEILDLPSLIFGTKPTPINWSEALFESVIITAIGSTIIYMTVKVFQQMASLEGVLPVCASCKRIRDDKGNWTQIEAYIRDRSEAEFSHSICPECREKLYPEFSSHKKNE